MEKKIIHKLFPTPVFQFRIENYENLNKELIKYIYNLREDDKDGIQRSNVDGWHSNNFKIEKDNIPYNFVKTIHGCVKENAHFGVVTTELLCCAILSHNYRFQSCGSGDGKLFHSPLGAPKLGKV